MTFAATDVDVLDALDFEHDEPCQWRQGAPDACGLAADWFVTYLFVTCDHIQTFSFCDAHRHASAECVAGYPVDIVSVEPVR